MLALSNRLKGAQDPAEWMLPDPSAACWYASAWVHIKDHWRLAADLAEIETLRAILNCGDFDTQAEAQAWHDTYSAHYGDVARLYADGDGTACASLP